MGRSRVRDVLQRRYLALAPTVLSLLMLSQFGLALHSGRALGQAPQATAQAPSLTLDLDHHRGPIRHATRDAAARVLATSEDAPPVRVWDLLSGALLRTLYLSPLPAARVTALALHEKGTQLAVALQTPNQEEGKAHSVLIVDWRSGEIVRSIPIEHSALSLTWKPGSSQLIASLASGALRLWDAQTGQEVAQDESSQAPCRLTTFDSQSRMVAWCDDGSVRLLSATLQRLAQTSAGSPESLRHVALSPDGRTVAVAKRESKTVELYSGTDLAPLPPDHMPAAAIDVGEVHQVAFLPSGALALAGTLRAGSQAVLVRMLPGSLAKPTVLPIPELAAVPSTPSTADVSALLPLPQDALWLSPRTSAWQVLAANGNALLQRALETSTIVPDSLRLDRTGTRLQFQLSPFNSQARTDATAQPRKFSLVVPDRLLSPSLRTDPPREPPPASVPEPSSRLRQLREQADVRYAMASADGRLLVAVLADGTLRWYAAEDGRLLLSYFLHPDGRRWIFWTQSGLYDASVDGESLLGWVVPRHGTSPQNPDFFRLGLLRAHFHRPDVVSRILFSGDEARALSEANAQSGRDGALPELRTVLPPVVKLLDPSEGTALRQNLVTLKVAVRSPSGEPITAVRALVQGRQVQVRDIVIERPQAPSSASAHSADGDVRTLQLSVPSENCTITVLAETRHAKSEPVLLPLRWQGPQPQRDAPKPALYVLSVGTSKYQRAHLELGFPAKDARDLARAFSEQQGKLYRSVAARVLTDDQATRDNILSGLAWLRQKTTAFDIAVFFLAGHGINDAATGRYYYLPHEADPQSPAETMLEAAQLQSVLATIRGKAVLFLDTCHSGNVLGSVRDSSGSNPARLVAELSSIDSGVVVFAASTSGQVSRESPRWGNGAFTKATVEGLRGKADFQGRGHITVSVLEHYISERVKELTQGEQTPTTAKPSTVPDFLLARVAVPLHRNPRFWLAVTGGLLATAAAITSIAVIASQDPQLQDGTYVVGFPVPH